MPSLFRATIGLKQRQWEWHRKNPGQLSQLAQEAVDQQIQLGALPDRMKDDALESAAARFFEEWALAGEYCIRDGHVVQHDATDDEMKTDAKWLGVPIDSLLPCLDELWQAELDSSLRKAAIRVAFRYRP